jgi:hypothetical protein
MPYQATLTRRYERTDAQPSVAADGPSGSYRCEHHHGPPQNSTLDRSPMIERGKMMEPMLSACPSFRDTWDEFVAEWQDQKQELPYYLVLSDLARHLVAMLERRDIAQFDAIFDVVEQWHEEGDPYVREAATIGLLEDLQNTNFYTSASPNDFKPYLREQSAKWWDKVERFWQRGEVIRD